MKLSNSFLISLLSLGILAVLGWRGVKTFTDTTDASSKTIGSSIFNGGIAVAKNAYFGGKISVGNTAVDSAVLSTFGGLSLSIANSAVVSIATQGLIVVREATSGGFIAVFITNGSTGTVIKLGGSAEITATENNAATLNVYFNGTIKVQNNLSGTRSVNIAVIGPGI